MNQGFFSIRGIAFGVLLVACNLFALRSILIGHPSGSLFFTVVGFVPMANIMSVVLFRHLEHKKNPRPFSHGFLFYGTLAVLGWLGICLIAGSNLEFWIKHTLIAFANFPSVGRGAARFAKGSARDTYYSVIGITSFILVSFTPQFLLALIGGSFTRQKALKYNP